MKGHQPYYDSSSGAKVIISSKSAKRIAFFYLHELLFGSLEIRMEFTH